MPPQGGGQAGDDIFINVDAEMRPYLESLDRMERETQQSTLRTSESFERMNRGVANTSTAIAGGRTKAKNFAPAVLELSRAGEDAAAVYGTTGLAGAIRASSNNISQSLATINPVLGILGAFGAAALAVSVNMDLLGDSMDESRKKTKEFEEDAKSLVATLKEIPQEFVGALPGIEGTRESIREQEELRKVLSEQNRVLQERKQRLEEISGELENRVEQQIRQTEQRLPGGAAAAFQPGGPALFSGERIDRAIGDLEEARERERRSIEAGTRDSKERLEVIEEELAKFRAIKAEIDSVNENQEANKKVIEEVNKARDESLVKQENLNTKLEAQRNTLERIRPEFVERGVTELFNEEAFDSDAVEEARRRLVELRKEFPAVAGEDIELPFDTIKEELEGVIDVSKLSKDELEDLFEALSGSLDDVQKRIESIPKVVENITFDDLVGSSEQIAESLRKAAEEGEGAFENLKEELSEVDKVLKDLEIPELEVQRIRQDFEEDMKALQRAVERGDLDPGIAARAQRRRQRLRQEELEEARRTPAQEALTDIEERQQERLREQEIGEVETIKEARNEIQGLREERQEVVNTLKEGNKTEKEAKELKEEEKRLTNEINQLRKRGNEIQKEQNKEQIEGIKEEISGLERQADFLRGIREDVEGSPLVGSFEEFQLRRNQGVANKIPDLLEEIRDLQQEANELEEEDPEFELKPANI